MKKQQLLKTCEREQFFCEKEKLNRSVAFTLFTSTSEGLHLNTLSGHLLILVRTPLCSQSSLNYS